MAAGSRAHPGCTVLEVPYSLKQGLSSPSPVAELVNTQLWLLRNDANPSGSWRSPVRLQLTPVRKNNTSQIKFPELYPEMGGHSKEGGAVATRRTTW
jgi:hypothetical protein